MPLCTFWLLSLLFSVLFHPLLPRWPLSRHRQQTSTIPRTLIRTKFTRRDGDGGKQTNQIPLSLVQPLGFIHHNFNWFLQVGNTSRQAQWLKSIGNICRDLDTNGLRNAHFGVHAAGQISRPGNYIYFCLLTSVADHDGHFGLLDIQFVCRKLVCREHTCQGDGTKKLW